MRCPTCRIYSALVVLALVQYLAMMFHRNHIDPLENNYLYYALERQSERRTTGSSTPPLLLNVSLRQKHPNCFSESLFLTDDLGNKVLRLVDSARYVYDASSVPRYDIDTCPIMKARYNCFTNSKSKHAAAYQWKMVLQAPTVVTNTSSDATSYCDLRAFAEDLNGPAGLARWYRENHRTDSASDRTHYNIAMFGNSFLRQTWESLTCMWRDQLTKLTVQQNGPDISLAALQQRTHAVRLAEMGSSIDLDLPPWNATTLGCHGGTDEINQAFYEHGLAVPKTIPNCDDNIGSAEFNGTFRIHYVFRPSIYESLEEIYEKLELQQDHVDAFFLTELKGQERKLSQKLGPQVKAHSSIWPVRYFGLQALQLREIRYWFGASNPGIHRPPDR